MLSIRAVKSSSLSFASTSSTIGIGDKSPVKFLILEINFIPSAVFPQPSIMSASSLVKTPWFTLPSIQSRFCFKTPLPLLPNFSNSFCELIFSCASPCPAISMTSETISLKFYWLMLFALDHSVNFPTTGSSLVQPFLSNIS